MDDGDTFYLQEYQGLPKRGLKDQEGRRTQEQGEQGHGGRNGQEEGSNIPHLSMEIKFSMGTGITRCLQEIVTLDRVKRWMLTLDQRQSSLLDSIAVQKLNTMATRKSFEVS